MDEWGWWRMDGWMDREGTGDRERDAKGVVRRPDLRMDWGVNSANPEEVTDIAKVLAFYDTE